MNSKIFDRFSFLSLLSVLVLLPIFFVPMTLIPVEISKGLLLVIGLTLCIIFWSIARFLDGKIVFPKSRLLLSALGIVFAFLLSTLFTKNIEMSLFGNMFDVGSFWFIFAGFLLMFFSSIVFYTTKRAKIVLFGTILSSVLLLIFQSLHLFYPKALSLGIFGVADKTANILGSWNALGLFAGFSSLMFLLVIEFFPISKIEKIILEIFILLAVLLAAVVNFPLVWILLGISSLIIFVYKASVSLPKEDEEQGSKRVFPFVSFVVLIISLLFFLSAGLIGNIVPNLKIANTEVVPPFGITMNIVKEVLVAHPILGIGPNKFTEAWSLYKPVNINYTQFWDTPFNFGFGLVPTFFVTIGGLGILAFLVFFVLFLFVGVKSVFSSIRNKVNWEMMAFFILSFYLFISSLFYFTGSVMFLLSFAFTGIFIGLISSGSSKEVSISFLNDHRKSFFSILILILIVITSVVLSFKYIERFISYYHYSQVFRATATLPVAENSINKALSLYVNDLYLRNYAQVNFLKLNSLAQKGESLSEAEKANLKVFLDQAVSGAQEAAKYNPTNYLNFSMLGSMYQDLASLGVKDVNSKAVEAYKTASLLNPSNPGIKLSIAIVLLADGKTKEAKDYANQAITLKQDYVDALLMLSQIAKGEGDNALAITYTERALYILPTNTDLAKYLDFLKKGTDTKASTPAPNTTKKK